jgi:hypothetical protein
VFVCWSGELSKNIGMILSNWLPSILQFVDPFFSVEDISKGSKWIFDLSKELESTDIGIICLTRENINKPWILFEAGALSKKIDSARVCTVLFNINPVDLDGPLSLFQHTCFVKEDFLRLIKSINGFNNEFKLEDKLVEKVFEMWWPDLEKQIHQLNKTIKTVEPVRNERELIEESLNLLRSMSLNMQERNKLHYSSSLENRLISGMSSIYKSNDEELSYNMIRRIVKGILSEELSENKSFDEMLEK